MVMKNGNQDVREENVNAGACSGCLAHGFQKRDKSTRSHARQQSDVSHSNAFYWSMELQHTSAIDETLKPYKS